MSNLPTTEATIERTAGKAVLSQTLGKSLTFTYTDNEGVVSPRKGYKVTSVQRTSKANGRVVIKAVDTLGNHRSFRGDRMIRTRFAGK